VPSVVQIILQRKDYSWYSLVLCHDGLLDSLIGYLWLRGAILISQFPQFFLLYLQRLGGHVNELKIHVNKLQVSAAEAGRSIENILDKLQSHTDQDFVSHGKMMAEMLTRYADLSKGYETLLDASLFARPFLFLRYFNPDIAKSTIIHYNFGLPISVEGGVYMLIGMLFGYLCYKLCELMITRMWGLVRGVKNA